jgi:hypothetical protein
MDIVKGHEMTEQTVSYKKYRARYWHTPTLWTTCIADNAHDATMAVLNVAKCDELDDEARAQWILDNFDKVEVEEVGEQWHMHPDMVTLDCDPIEAEFPCEDYLTQEGDE